jgi:hypothetical protein
MFDVMVQMLAHVGTLFLNTGIEQEPQGSAHPFITPWQAFRCADDHYIVVAPREEHFWRRLTQALGRPELGTRSEFADAKSRQANRDVLLPAPGVVLCGEAGTRMAWRPARGRRPRCSREHPAAGVRRPSHSRTGHGPDSRRQGRCARGGQRAEGRGPARAPDAAGALVGEGHDDGCKIGAWDTARNGCGSSPRAEHSACVRRSLHLEPRR